MARTEEAANRGGLTSRPTTKRHRP